MATEESVTVESLARELVDRCVKAETKAAIIEHRETLLYRAVRDALRSKSPEKSRAVLSDAMAAWEAML